MLPQEEHPNQGTFNHEYTRSPQILIPIREISAAKKAISKANKDYGALGELGVIPELANIYTATHIVCLLTSTPHSP